ncbi:MAG: ribose-5-phosphate isomerase [Candidatus Taylorbacteria bacterium RIFCSPLOWO2_12_FULL_43_20]|uniref:Ribose-5-phosphate isomerase n=1 Tax=Candidatus Taylorbacteria bacterium RIFCSPLOWO2_12_FULL_43_20 TaxID=1802332 RepID=A0A1G2P509_9BACT|nr:MAG: ribose-5-phosphate isomerase [Candidatus Taylorbacteria bacterium RIFCSPHIGHO2_01_FULL_43_120]OHA22038.1 MAG: ribose-5-phosphate isomerase [Candidatus Taylorbacteria bacterium RIFCSPHIGHO2_02_FULL_43_55]OHA30383.1 MAG: ribose-5-phosphate isomerase [Candidatus Taylorbacteria bacterium RIFCSPHIGHO2_12_FULL_42_34]OHA31535.1 MAG: ribose-5-phosphate isomerase [Candidatus Taylorbacteria bacterium RIFCSPLOWO2_01_FULL_43_83]OHA39753.1 MAG: ribose-5-phosphate isomerase [Candidatus Taylorbacteria
MKILIGSDHAGFEYKNQLRNYLETKGFEVEDFGAKKFDDNDNYPEILTPLAFKISENPTEYKGIVLGKSGQGEAIVCNRFPGVRAIVYDGENLEVVKLGREHNDANVLSLGAHFMTIEEAKQAVDTWLETPFSGDERHKRRNKMLDDIG